MNISFSLRAVFIALLFILAAPISASAQSVNLYCWNPSGSGLNQFVPCSSSNPLPTTATSVPQTISTTSCSALCANQIIDGAPGSLYSFNVSADSTLSAAAWWIMIYNATSAPADGSVTPFKCYAMATGTTSFSAAFPTPVPFSAGITMGVSTTGCFNKTASTHAFISGDYK